MGKNSAKGFDILHVHVISKTGQVPVYRNGENAACFKEMNLVCDRKNVYQKCNCQEHLFENQQFVVPHRFLPYT